MRIIKQIPHQFCRISIMAMNDKYIVKFELGDYEQIYKYETEDIGSVEALVSYFTSAKIDAIVALFFNMKEINN